jgi:hypothetical protein
MCYSCSIRMQYLYVRGRSLRVCTLLLASAIALSAQARIQPGTLPSDVREDDFPLATPVEAVNPGSPALDLHGKFDYYIKSVSSAEIIGRLVLSTSLGRADRGSYMENFAGRYAETLTRRTVQFGIGALRGEDPRFHRSGKEGFWPRTAFVLSRTVLTDMDSGTTSVAAGRLVGNFTGNALSSFWAHGDPNPWKHGLTGTGVNLAGDLGMRMVREFWPDLKHAFKK